MRSLPILPADAVPRGFTVWLTGVSGAGKSTAAHVLEQRLLAAGTKVEVLDGDVIRTHLSKGLGFNKEDRDENIRRIGFVCELLSRNGVATIVAAISPYREARCEVRSRIRHFVEVHMTCPLAVLVDRDPKGLYKKALAGEIAHFTGISDPYEPPLSPEVVIDSSVETPEQSADRIFAALRRLELVS
jgi:adenylyl-sulfate kinase